MLLLAIQGAYKSVVNQERLTIETYAQCLALPDELKTTPASGTAIATHLANYGFTTIEADDAQIYACNWLIVSSLQGLLVDIEHQYSQCLLCDTPQIMS